MQEHSKFSDIGQFRNIIHTIITQSEYIGKDDVGNPIYDKTKVKPILKFNGTVKLHGTNAGINSGQGSLFFQSKERIITPLSDNAGFAFYAQSKVQIFKQMIDDIRTVNSIPEENDIVIFGEWVGKSINSTVAISKLEKSFFIFAVKIINLLDTTSNYYLDISAIKDIKSEENRIFNIYDYKTFQIEIDFNDYTIETTDDGVEKYIFNSIYTQQLESIAEEIGSKCPVAKEFGEFGIGEGVVFSTFWNGSIQQFKVKDERHCAKKPQPIKTVVDDTFIQNVKRVAEIVTPAFRLDQMFTKANNLLNSGNIDRKNLGEFIKLVIADIIKEESDILIDNKMEIKELNKYISIIARDYFFSKEIV